MVITGASRDTLGTRFPLGRGLWLYRQRRRRESTPRVTGLLQQCTAAPVARVLLAMRQVERSRPSAALRKAPLRRVSQGLHVLPRHRQPSIPPGLRPPNGEHHVEPPRREGRHLPTDVRDERPPAPGVPRGAPRRDTFEDLSGKWQAAILKADQNRPDLRIVGSG
jgi:hypothetical protein